MIRMLQMSGCCHDTQNRFFPKHCRQNGNTDIDKTVIDLNTEMSVLRDSLLCDIQIGQDFDTGDQWCMNISLDRDIFHDHTVDTHTDFCLFFKWFNMNITRLGFDRTLDQ